VLNILWNQEKARTFAHAFRGHGPGGHARRPARRLRCVDFSRFFGGFKKKLKKIPEKFGGFKNPP